MSLPLSAPPGRRAFDERRPRVRVLEDALLAATALAAIALGGPFARVLGGGAAAVLAWQLATLHRPLQVVLDAGGVTFSRYGRSHAFAWSEVRRLSIRRFLVRDRVLVRLEPSGGPLRGRYWLDAGLVGFDELVRALEERAVRTDFPS